MKPVVQPAIDAFIVDIKVRPRPDAQRENGSTPHPGFLHRPLHRDLVAGITVEHHGDEAHVRKRSVVTAPDDRHRAACSLG